MPASPKLRQLSPAVLAAIGLSSACRLGPCLKMAETGTGPCLSPEVDTDTGPCLDIAPHSDSPGDSRDSRDSRWDSSDSQDSVVGPCLDMVPDTGCDSGDSGCDSGQQAQDAGMARVLDAAKTELTHAFTVAVDAVLERRVLPEDVAARLRALRGVEEKD
jgi:hypothetical protein